MTRSLYSNDNVAYRQFVGQTLTGIMQGISELNDLDPANIKLGAEILGYTGTYTTEEVADAVTALDIAEGKVAYVNGERIVGLAGIAEYALTISLAGGTGGSVTVDGDAYVDPINYKAGEEIALVATPEVGDSFVNWTIDAVEVSVEATFTYTMETSAVEIVANFVTD